MFWVRDYDLTYILKDTSCLMFNCIRALMEIDRLVVVVTLQIAGQIM